MPKPVMEFYREKHRKLGGGWIATRYLKNQGIPFESAYEIIFGRKPRAALCN